MIGLTMFAILFELLLVAFGLLAVSGFLTFIAFVIGYIHDNAKPKPEVKESATVEVEKQEEE